MTRSDAGILFHVDGPTTEKSRSPNFCSRPYWCISCDGEGQYSRHLLEFNQSINKWNENRLQYNYDQWCTINVELNIETQGNKNAGWRKTTEITALNRSVSILRITRISWHYSPSTTVIWRRHMFSATDPHVPRSAIVRLVFPDHVCGTLCRSASVSLTCPLDSSVRR